MIASTGGINHSAANHAAPPRPVCSVTSRVGFTRRDRRAWRPPPRCDARSHPCALKRNHRVPGHPASPKAFSVSSKTCGEIVRVNVFEHVHADLLRHHCPAAEGGAGVPQVDPTIWIISVGMHLVNFASLSLTLPRPRTSVRPGRSGAPLSAVAVSRGTLSGQYLSLPLVHAGFFPY